MNDSIPIVLCGGIFLILLLCGTQVVRRYVKLSTGNAIILLILALVAGIAGGVLRYADEPAASPIREWSNRVNDSRHWAGLCAGFLATILVLFAAKMHSLWIGGNLTDAEKAPGAPGMRAWLTFGNVLVVLMISLLAWLAFDYSPLGIAFLGFAVLIAYPAATSFSMQRTTPITPAFAAERQRVLNMLDAGKITSAECAELLAALGESEPRPAKPLAPLHNMTLIGAALLVIGFFLPWFSINTQTEANRILQKFSGNSNWTLSMPSMPTIRIVGGDIEHGLGWAVLILGIAAAVLPYFVPTLNEQTRQRIVLGVLGCGSIILFYLFTQNLHYISIGILLAAIGYGVQLTGAIQSGRQNGAIA